MLEINRDTFKTVTFFGDNAIGFCLPSVFLSFYVERVERERDGRVSSDYSLTFVSVVRVSSEEMHRV